MVEPTLALILADEQATTALGAAIARSLSTMTGAIEQAGMSIAIAGELGSGKTSLVRALLRHFGITGSVKSPTFALLEPYEVSRLHLYHFDFYRFKNPHEFVESGFSELFQPGSICLVEWPERAGEYLPVADLSIRLTVLESERSAVIGAKTTIGERCLEQIRTYLKAVPAGA
ncbi:MAG TPA: tRNA (adenosine(37)-N6)-threonylcarbamoyltransferase complex ATPase subunit type 1 TsaE [Burkholderiaceae bacterium]|nr:tRNA (adenosine(37)-N6)-threonylcarbamoyltransferase complex ATPase subunit type 1 TsaE [Burkholderiaceae bacterium]